MSSGGVDTSRRRFLVAATAAVGGVGTVFAAYPFLASWQPSARAQAAGAPLQVDISKLDAGAMMIVEWRGKPVWVVRRTEAMLSKLKDEALLTKLRDPKSVEPQQPTYCENDNRSIKPDYLVMIGICTHLGCSPTYRPQPAEADLGKDWPGGFQCACHGSRFDLSGRVFQGVPAPTNMVIPPHQYLSETVLLVGEDKGAA